MNTLSLPTKKVGIMLCMSIGYTPLVISFLFVGDLDWGRLYGNEAIAWLLIFGVFDILAIVNACRILRVARGFASVAILLSLVPLVWGLLAWREGDMGPSSKEDTDFLSGMIDFWFGGAGYLAMLIVVPLFAWYLYLRFNGRKTTTL